MKKITFSLIIFTLLAIGNSYAQESIQGKSITLETDSRELHKWFKTYEIVELDLSALSRMVNKEESRISLQIGQNKWNLNLFFNDLRSSNYTNTNTNGNNKILQEKKPCITYAGYVDDNPANYVRLTISDEIFRGYIVVENEFYYFDQLKRIIGNSDKNIIISYRARDVQENSTSVCGITSSQEKAFLSQVQSSTQVRQSGVSTCRILELATDADFEWFQLHGSNSNNEILAIINMIQGVYQNVFNIEIIVVFQNVYTNVNDPYTGNPLTSAGSVTMVTELRTNWENNFGNVERDLVHLFTGRNPNVGGVTGRVYAIGTVCIARDKSYGFTRERINQFTTTAHEIGHNFGGVHANGQFCGTANATIMCQGLKAIPLVFSNASTNTIEAFMNTNSTCLLEFDNLDIVGSGLICNNQTKTYSVNTALNGNVTWSVNNANLTIISGQGTSTVTVRGNRFISGAATLSASIPANNCDVVVTKSIWVGRPSSFTTNPSGVPAVQASLGSWVVIRVFSTPGASISSLNWWTNNSSALDLNIGSGNCSVECQQTGYNYVYVNSSNACGTSPYRQIPINVTSGGGGGGQMFSVMPNPSSSYIDIELPFKVEQGKGEKVDVSIFNDKSTPVYSKTYTQSNFKINTQTLPEGLYYLQVVYKENLYSQQILIKR